MQAEMPQPARTGMPAGLAQPETRAPGGHTQHHLLSCHCPPGAPRTPTQRCAPPTVSGLPYATFPNPQLPSDPSICPRLSHKWDWPEAQPGPVELGLNSAPGRALSQVTCCLQGAESLPDTQRRWLRGRALRCLGHQQGSDPGPPPHLPGPCLNLGLCPLQFLGDPDMGRPGTSGGRRAALTEDRASSLLLPWLCRPMKARADSL